MELKRVGQPPRNLRALTCLCKEVRKYVVVFFVILEGSIAMSVEREVIHSVTTVKPV